MNPLEKTDFFASGFDLRSRWRLINQHLWVSASIFVLILFAVVLWTVRQTKIYEASCSVIIDLSAPKVLDKDLQDVVESGSGILWYSKEYYETQYKIITSRGVAERVTDKLHLAENATFLGLDRFPAAVRAEKRKLLDPVEVVRSRLIVEPVKDSRVVRIRVEDPDANLASELANAFAEAYIEETLSVKLSTTKRASVWLEDQLRALEDKVRSSTETLYEFKKRHDIVSTSWEDRQSMVSQRLVAINEALTKTRMQKAQLQSRVEEIRKASINADKNLAALDALPTVAASQLVQQLKLRVLDLSGECTELQSRYLDDHPKMIACHEKLASAKANLQREIRSLLAAAESEYSEGVQTEKHLSHLFSQTKDEAFQFNVSEREYSELRRAADSNQRLYDLILKRLKEADLSGMLHMSNVRVLDRARPAKIPIRPRLAFNVLIGILLALLAAIGVPMVLDYFDGSIRTQEQVERLLGLTVLGLLPSVERNNQGDGPELVFHTSPKSSLAECCRAVRTNLLFMSPDKPPRTISITSGNPQDGKTMVATNLAIAMAENRNRTLLLDADMRRPRIHKIFNVSNGVGLSSLILGQGSLEDTIRSTAVANLSILTCGPIPPNPAELLHAEAFSLLLSKIRDRFDRIIIDTPPVGPVTDAIVLSTLVDGTVLVLKAGKTSREQARRSIRALRDVKGRMFGVVLNDVDRSYGGYSDYYPTYALPYESKESTSV